MERPEWKSPRKVTEEMRDYQRGRFEAYMRMVDDGTLPRAIAITAMQDEMESGLWRPPYGPEQEADSGDAAA